MKRLLLRSIPALALLAWAPAQAADLGVAPFYKAPVAVAPVTNWTGSYIGISGGGAWGDAVVHSTTGANITPSFNISGGIIGITSGYNYQTGSLVFGYEGDTSFTTKKGSAFDVAPFNPAFRNEIKENWLSTYRGRVGFAQDNWLFYGTGGFALARVEQNVFAPGGTEISQKRWQSGWTAGGGVEVKFAQDWSAKAEYLFVDLHQKSYFNPAPSVLFLNDQRARLNDHIFRVGVDYKLPFSFVDLLLKR